MEKMVKRFLKISNENRLFQIICIVSLLIFSCKSNKGEIEENMGCKYLVEAFSIDELMQWKNDSLGFESDRSQLVERMKEDKLIGASFYCITKTLGFGNCGKFSRRNNILCYELTPTSRLAMFFNKRKRLTYMGTIIHPATL